MSETLTIQIDGTPTEVELSTFTYEGGEIKYYIESGKVYKAVFTVADFPPPGWADFVAGIEGV